MSALSVTSIKSIAPFLLPSSPVACCSPLPEIAALREVKIIGPCCSSLISCKSMADSTSSSTSLPRFECDENGGTTGAVSPKFAEIIIVRHGETEWNVVHRIQGQLDVDLNDVGRQQAVAVAKRLSREPKISAVYSSDLKRAYETAEVIAKHCGVPEVIKEPGFRERHVGDIQGVVFSDIAKVNPIAYKAFVSNQDDQEIPGGGESFNQLYDRCTSALQRIAQKHQGERVVVVSHGGTIRALHRRASGKKRAAQKVLNTSVTTLHVSNKDKWSIIMWGDTSHLDLTGTGFLHSGFGGDANSA
ncbi:phosphoglycerate mutase-like protein 4 [Andrographis paniculata]|uniref:phosphoglycerate mutase-like protein 4 n=1 Tax=Andrographis paniculata TaxID=175694 RepID=UPI0021E9AD88|nr:phosphoglycerate mutase-like protein 4 [Andrographis paniculata]